MNVWLTGFGVWLVLLIVTFRYCSGRRSRMWVYGLTPIGLLLWCAPNMAFGSLGAKAAAEVIGTYGFWVSAIYLGVLLIAELVSGRKLRAES